MTAMAKARPIREERWAYKQFTLASGKKAYKGGLAVYDQSAGKMIPAETGASQTDLFVLGLFAEDVDATSADKLCNVQLKREVVVRWFANGTVAATANDIGKDAYGQDDQTVATDSATSTRSKVGIIWAVDASRGVAVELN